MGSMTWIEIDMHKALSFEAMEHLESRSNSEVENFEYFEPCRNSTT